MLGQTKVIFKTVLLGILLQQSQAILGCFDVDIGAEFGDVRPLDEGRMKKLTINGYQLLDRIDPNDAFITELGSVGCITWPQRDHLIDTLHQRDRNSKLLEFLSRRSVAGFEKFIKVLSKEQAHLVPFLVTDGGETTCEQFE